MARPLQWGIIAPPFSDGLRRKYSDGKRQRLENLIDHILVGAATCVAARKAKREENERREREWAEAEKLCQERKRRRRLEDKRWEFLECQIERFEAARRIDSFVEDYLYHHPIDELPASCKRLIEWATGRAEAIRKSGTPERLTAVLEEHRLMDDNTDIDSWIKFGE